MGSVSLQWSLNQTSQDVIGISTGLLRAATSDNVQILALLACERFGATLAMSHESCHKAFLLCDQSHSSVLSFIKLQVGYMKGDSGYELARSDAGLRFLGLAACLSTLEPWNAAVVLHDLISKTAHDRTMVPSTQQLKQLVLALQARLSRSGFCESVCGWASIVMHELDDHDSTIEVPSDKTIAALVTALSHTARLGDENSKVRVSTPTMYAPWIIAFIKWCLGQSPRVIFEDGRTRGLDSGSQVSVQFVQPEEHNEVRVETYDHVGNLKDLVSDRSPSQFDFKGLVSARTYGQSVLRERFGAPTNIEYRACLQALPYACSFFRTHYTSLFSHEGLDDKPAAYGGSKAVLGQAFPSEQKIYQIIYEYQGATSGRSNLSLPVLGEQRITDLSLVSLAHSQLSLSCDCGDCSPFSIGCRVQAMYKGIIACVADVLVLSLFQPIDPEGVQVWYSFNPGRQSFRDLVYELILGHEGEKTTLSVTRKIDFLNKIVEYALGLVGHSILDEKLWIMSSYHGQTIYPLSFSSQVIEQSSVLSLCCIPGNIIWNDERYSFVRSVGSSSGANHDSTAVDSSVLLTPRNDYAHYDLKWEIYPSDIELEAGISLPNFPTMPTLEPRLLIISSLFSIYVTCSHEKLAGFQPNGLGVVECPPHHQREIPGKVRVIQANNNERIRHATLASDYEFVIRMQACLECCIKCSVLNAVSDGMMRVIC